ncbi:hypothetical protein [Corynebacterium provencense]|uniref:hypothetical protein n=1 Tax=Corynebacterium provencense TaxID=1737425 RepID=UPI0008344F4F|nr:hypothetical protein [Corynebacterium provencense]
MIDTTTAGLKKLLVAGVAAPALILAACDGDDGGGAATTADTTQGAAAEEVTTRTVTVTETMSEAEAVPDDGAASAAGDDAFSNSGEPAADDVQEPDTGSTLDPDLPPLYPQAVGTWIRHGLSLELNEAGFGYVQGANGAMNTVTYQVRWSGQTSEIDIEILDMTRSLGDVTSASAGLSTGKVIHASVEGDQMYLDAFNGMPVCRDTGDYSDWAC